MSVLLSPFTWLLNSLNIAFDSYGIAILIFAVVVKTLLFPFSIKGKRGMIQMNMVSGKVQAIKKRCGKDTARYNQEVQELYTREKINPMGGCLWTLLPLFVLIPLYAIIRAPIEYMLYLNEAQILELANLLQWDTIAVARGWVNESAIVNAMEKNLEDGFIIASGFANTGNNQLLLASLIQGGEVLSDGTIVNQMNFQFLGMDLSQIPNWKIWQDMTISNLASIVLVAISAGTGIILSKISQNTNKMSNQPKNEQMEQTNRMMMITMPLMAVWIGFIMPAIMCLYWVANNLLSIILEIIAGKLLKKDYENARIAQEEQDRLDKEAEKLHKQKIAEEREKRKLEEKTQKKKPKKVKKDPDEQQIDKSASRVGMRSHARGRNYDPNRYPNPWETEKQEVPELPETPEIEEEPTVTPIEEPTPLQSEETNETTTETTEQPTETTEEKEDWSKGSVLDQFEKPDDR
ncbi:MAG: YidC/Oxa1 family membrane protein insertase [Eubacteriales bacterium]